MPTKQAVSASWIAGKVNSAQGVTPGRVDRFFGGMADAAARTGQKAQASSMMGNKARGAVMNRVSDKAMTAAEAATYHPKFPMGKLSSAKEAGIKEVLMQEIPGTKPWLLGRPGMSEATSVVGKLKKPMGAVAGGRTANGAYDVSAMAKQMGLHNRKMASAFGAELDNIIRVKIAGLLFHGDVGGVMGYRRAEEGRKFEGTARGAAGDVVGSLAGGHLGGRFGGASGQLGGSVAGALVGAHLATKSMIHKKKEASRVGDFMEGARHEAGPAAGATIGAGLAKAYGVDPLAGAAAGYGLGATPEIVRGIREKMLSSRVARQQIKLPL